MNVVSKLIIILVILSSYEAFARRDQRKGFNFGTSLYQHSGSHPGILSSQLSENKTLSQSTARYSPYLAYSFDGVFNLGLSIESEREYAETRVTLSKTGESLLIREDNRLQGSQIFGRVLFGRYFYAMAGLGYYQRVFETSTQAEAGQSVGTFSGTRDRQVLSNQGGGYQVGLGVEVPISKLGFFATGSYTARTLHLKKIKGADTQGSYNGTDLSEQFNFGLAYYFQ